MIENYMILENTDATQLTFRVRQAIKDGWQPMGSLQMACTSSFVTTYAQAMVRLKAAPMPSQSVPDAIGISDENLDEHGGVRGKPGALHYAEIF